MIKINPAEKHSRSLIKAISYRVLSISADSVAAFLFTQDAKMTVGIVAFVNGYSMILYFLHERVWANIHWGRILKKKDLPA